jgi:hypothetical protein
LKKLQGPEVVKLLIVVDELNIQSLISYIQSYLINHQVGFLQQNPIEILEAVYQHESFTDLWNYYLEAICENPNTLFESYKFTSLKAPLLKLLLGRDDLELDEIFIWDSLLKWGLAQNLSISKDITKWSKEDITIMERTLHEFIPLVRFYYISSDDFLDKIFPLKKLLPKDLAKDLVIFHIAPNRKPNIDKVQPPRQSSKCTYDTTLINNQHFTILASWIDKKENLHYNMKNIPYNFNLLYRFSRDGKTPKAFHTKCDNKGPTIVIAKVSNSEKIIGGYNPLFWDSTSREKPTNDSFIYLFTNNMNTKSAKISYSSGDRYSIRNLCEYGPGFGRGSDLICCQGGSWYGLPTVSYPKIDGIPTGYFNVDDYEVFQVIKK